MRIIRIIPVYFAFLLAGCGPGSEGEEGVITGEQPEHRQLSYVGKQSCNNCHPEENRLYTGSQHDLSMQVAGPDTVLGNFNNISFNYYDTTSTFFRRNEKYLVNTVGMDGVPADFEIKYTFGIFPLQQYLVEFPHGRLQVLGIAWDSRPLEAGGQHWFHLYPDEKIDFDDELHWTGINQNWNYMCAECHSSGLQKNFDPDTNSYQTSWAEIDVSCESCHGPGSRHVYLAENMPADEFNKIEARGLPVDFSESGKTNWTFKNHDSIASLDTPVNQETLISTCARCHSRRITIDSHEQYNKRLNDTHKVSLLDPDLYYPDGQAREEVYVYGSFIQSKMYAAGVSCNDCHDPHSADLRIPGNGLCLKCHRQDVYNVESHHFHEPGSEASICISCHMPAGYFMVIDMRYDHSFRIPRPDLTLKHGVPNTCNQCHADKTPQWALESVTSRYGNHTEGFHFSDAFDAASKSQPDSYNLLLKVIKDEALPAIIRATAVQLAGPYFNGQDLQPVIDMLSSPYAMLRAASLEVLAGLQVPNRLQLAGELLDDPVKSVRISAAGFLAPLSTENLPRKQKQMLDEAIREYISALEENNDRAYSHHNLGNLYLDMKQFEKAEKAYKKAIELEGNFIPAYVNLTELYRQSGYEDLAGTTLRRGISRNPEAAVLYHTLGLSQVRQKKYDQALISLETASRIEPENIRYALVYGIALNSTGKTEDAINFLTSFYDEHKNNRELLMTLATIHRDEGNIEEATTYAKRLVEITQGDDQQAQQLLNSLTQ